MEMHCPRCGTKAETNERYCRKCGQELSGVIEILNGDVNGEHRRAVRPHMTFIRVGIGLFLFGTVLGLASIIIRDLELLPVVLGKAIFLSFIMAGIMAIGLGMIIPYRPKRPKLRSGDLTAEDQFQTNELNRELSPGSARSEIEDAAIATTFEPEAIGSVTDSTTRQLK